MRKAAYLFLLTLILVSCGTDSHHFKFEGRFLHLNQGEFYVYSPDGDRNGLDTIKVEAGRFTYEIPCKRPMTLVIIFPNYSEQPVFAEPGKSVDIKGDASHLKEMKVKGTKANELMNSFREQVASASPPEVRKYASQFIEDHPQSLVGNYLVYRYFIQTDNPDHKTASHLLEQMIAKQPQNGFAKRLYEQVKTVSDTRIGQTLPDFTATGINGEKISSKELREKEKTVVCFWASWSYESTAQMLRLHQLQRQSESDFRLVGVCLDPDIRQCRNFLKRDSMNCPVICDEKMIEGNIVRKFGIKSIPDNLLIENGKITSRSLSTEDIINRLKGQYNSPK